MEEEKKISKSVQKYLSLRFLCWGGDAILIKRFLSSGIILLSIKRFEE